MNRTVFASSAVVLLLVACGGSSVAVGKTDTTQQLQTRKDGSATGDGTTCSWADTALFDQVKASSPSVGVPTYKLGDEFSSIDGCNECECAAKGIMCTVKTCEPKGCTREVQLCPDGSSVGRQGPSCEFAACPGTVACTDDAKKCPDGSFVGRTGPKCEFVCPGDLPIACDASAMQCPDGSYVGRTGPNCEFVCPGASCESIAGAVNKQISDAIEAGRECTQDADCIDVARKSDCTDTCTVRMNKAKVAAVDSAKAQVNANQCLEFKKLSCPVAAVACAPYPSPPKCVDKKCQ